MSIMILQSECKTLLSVGLFLASHYGIKLLQSGGNVHAPTTALVEYIKWKKISAPLVTFHFIILDFFFFLLPHQK